MSKERVADGAKQITIFGNGLNKPCAANYKAESRALMKAGTNRFSMAVAFIICAVVSVAAYYSIYSFLWIVFGRYIIENDENIYFLVVWTLILALALLISAPVYHGYKITAARTAQTGKTNLLDMFVPFSSFRMYMVSLYSGFVSTAPFMMTLLWYAESASRNNYTMFLLALPFFILSFFAFRAFRRVARISAFYTDKSFGYAWKLAFTSPRTYRRTHLGTAASFFGQDMLTLITILIYGVYNAFGQYAIASALTVADLKILTVPRKDNIQ